MKLFTSIDEKIEHKGYTKVEDTEWGVRYEKTEPQNYVNKVEICHKENGQHLLHSYTGFDDAVGLSFDELLLFTYKFFLLTRKWKRE